MAKRRTKAQRSAAAKAAWAAKRASEDAKDVSAATKALGKSPFLGDATGKIIVEERNALHGDFAQNAFVSQSIKSLIRRVGAPPALQLTDVQAEAIDMIALKLSRIASGKAGHADHWVDIIGYAQLALNEINAK